MSSGFIFLKTVIFKNSSYLIFYYTNTKSCKYSIFDGHDTYCPNFATVLFYENSRTFKDASIEGDNRTPGEGAMADSFNFEELQKMKEKAA